MKKNYKNKEIGKLTKTFCLKYGIPKDYYEYKIMQSFGLIYHVQKHIENFMNVESFNYTLCNLKETVDNPYYVIYDFEKNSIKYFKKFKEYVCVVVNITNFECHISTFYPVNKYNIDKLKNK